PTGVIAAALDRADRALSEFRIEGVSTNIPFLRALLQDAHVQSGAATTRFVDEHLGDLMANATAITAALEASGPMPGATPGAAAPSARAGAQVDANDPLAVLTYG